MLTTATMSSSGQKSEADLSAFFAERIEKGTIELPLLPEVASRILTMTSDEGCDLKALADLVRKDQAMAGHLLRVANSPLYAGTSSIVSIQQALARLGMNQLREVALLISCQARVFRVKGYEQEVREIFRHSLASALFAREIARMRRWNVEEAFLCGLLHEVGKPVLYQLTVDLQKELKREFDREHVKAAVNVEHARVGALLVTKWSLPARLSETILHHHEPHLAKNFAQTTMMTAFADDLADYLLGTAPHEEAFIKGHPLLEPLNLYPEELESLLSKTDMILASLEATA